MLCSRYTLDLLLRNLSDFISYQEFTKTQRIFLEWNNFSHRNYFEVWRERLLPDDEEGVGQVEAEEDDAARRRGDVGAREERRDEEAQHDGAHLRGNHVILTGWILCL